MSDDLSGPLRHFERLYKEEVAKNEILLEEMERLRDQGGLARTCEELQEENKRLRETHDALQVKYIALLEKEYHGIITQLRSEVERLKEEKVTLSTPPRQGGLPSAEIVHTSTEKKRRFFY